MVPILIVYASHDGQTAKICVRLDAVLRLSGHATLLCQVDRAPETLEPGAYGAALVAGPVRMGKHPQALVAWTRRNAAALQALPNAFISVSLSADRDRPAARREVAKCFARFIRETSFAPGRLASFRGALLYTRYPWTTKLAMKVISRLMQGDTDTSRDYEYTDWNAVEAFTRDFGRQLPAPESAAA